MPPYSEIRNPRRKDIEDLIREFGELSKTKKKPRTTIEALPTAEEFRNLDPSSKAEYVLSMLPGPVSNAPPRIPGNAALAGAAAAVTAYAARKQIRQSAIQGYRDVTPLPVRAFLHSLYGQGRPLTYLRPKDRERIINTVMESANLEDQRDVVVQDLLESSYSPKDLEKRLRKHEYLRPDLVSLNPIETENKPFYFKQLGQFTNQSVGGAFYLRDPITKRPSSIYDLWKIYKGQVNSPKEFGRVAGKNLSTVLSAMKNRERLKPYLRQLSSQLPHLGLSPGGIIESVLSEIAKKYSKPYIISASLRPDRDRQFGRTKREKDYTLGVASDFAIADFYKMYGSLPVSKKEKFDLLDNHIELPMKRRIQLLRMIEENPEEFDRVPEWSKVNKKKQNIKKRGWRIIF